MYWTQSAVMTQHSCDDNSSVVTNQSIPLRHRSSFSITSDVGAVRDKNTCLYKASISDINKVNAINIRRSRRPRSCDVMRRVTAMKYGAVGHGTGHSRVVLETFLWTVLLVFWILDLCLLFINTYCLGVVSRIKNLLSEIEC